MQHIFGKQSPAVWELEVILFQRVAACKLLYRCLVSILRGSKDHQIIRLNSLLENTTILVGIYNEQFQGTISIYIVVFDFQGIVIYTSTSLSLQNEEVAVNGQVTGWYYYCAVANRSTPKCPSTDFSPPKYVLLVLYTFISFTQHVARGNPNQPPHVF